MSETVIGSSLSMGLLEGMAVQDSTTGQKNCWRISSISAFRCRTKHYRWFLQMSRLLT
jgi:hypothetical protein